MQPITLTQFEVGQLYALISPAGLGKLSPELRRKLKQAFDSADRSPLPIAYGTGVTTLPTTGGTAAGATLAQ